VSVPFAAHGAGEKPSHDGDTEQGDTVKKIIIGAAAMGGAALVAFGASGTFAAYQAQDAAAIKAGAGSFNMTLKKAGAGALAQSAPVSAGNMAPGGTSNDFAYTVTNSKGSAAAGKVTVNFKDLTEAGENTGVFSQNVHVVASTGALGPNQTCEYNASTASDLGTLYQAVYGGVEVKPQDVLLPGDTECVVLQLRLPKEAGNDIQGQSSTFSVQFTLNQNV
jgi:hypothetical protein